MRSWLGVGVIWIAACASIATAETVPMQGQLTIQINVLDPIVLQQSPSPALATVARVGGRIDQLSFAGGLFETDAVVVPVTDEGAFPIAGFEATISNAAAAFVRSGNRFGGQMPLIGGAKVCLFGPCSAALQNLNVPLSVAGMGGVASVAGAVNLTVRGAPWTTATAAIGTITRMGGTTPAAVSVVTPIFVSTNIGASPVVPMFGFLGIELLETPSTCEDSEDDDHDGLIDFPADPGCASADDDSEQAENLVCDDGADNDADGVADANDPGCEGPTDASEKSTAIACDDGSDNDGDGLTDALADPGCDGPGDSSERGSAACDNATDDDGDGFVDLADPGCTGAADSSERAPTRTCDDGIDNDGDALVDFPSDPGCDSGSDPSERSPNLTCEDGLDNDGDTRTDYPADPGCSSATDTSERSA